MSGLTQSRYQRQRKWEYHLPCSPRPTDRLRLPPSLRPPPLPPPAYGPGAVQRRQIALSLVQTPSHHPVDPSPPGSATSLPRRWWTAGAFGRVGSWGNELVENRKGAAPPSDSKPKFADSSDLGIWVKMQKRQPLHHTPLKSQY